MQNPLRRIFSFISLVAVSLFLFSSCDSKRYPIREKDKDPLTAAEIRRCFVQKGYNLAGAVRVQDAGLLTGEASLNQTKSNYGVGGTDLGIPFRKGDTMYFAFGDTFSGENMQGGWRNNVLAYTKDFNAADGIRFSGMRMNSGQKNYAKELIPGQKTDQVEMTIIPTGGFSYQGALYLFFMSVKTWGPAGQWDCNYGGLAKSTDDGNTWEKLKDIRWPGTSMFCQNSPLIKGDTLYLFGITGGRNGCVKLARVKLARLEDFSAYEYFTGLNEKGSPVWGTEQEDMLLNSAEIVRAPAGELSVSYNQYLKEYIMAYQMGPDLVIRSAKQPWGPWSEPHKLLTQADYPGLYCAFLHPVYSESNGKYIYFMMSQWAPVYNVRVMRCRLVRSNELKK